MEHAHASLMFDMRLIANCNQLFLHLSPPESMLVDSFLACVCVCTCFRAYVAFVEGTCWLMVFCAGSICM